MIQPDDPWGFEEEAAETWTDLLNAQAVDLGVLAVFLLLAYVSFHRKSAALKYVTLVAAVAYMGFAKSYLISITNIFSVLEGNLPVFRYNLAWYLFFGFTVVSTVLWGRFYCGRICAFGAFTQLMDAVLPDGGAWTCPRPSSGAPAGSSSACWRRSWLLLRDQGHDGLPLRRAVLDVRAVRDQRGAVGRPGVLLLATVFVRNLYCRFLCPVGATLGLMSLVTIFRIKRWSECNTCKICEKTCEWGAIEGPRSSRPSACAATTASASTPTRPSARTGGFSTTRSARTA